MSGKPVGRVTRKPAESFEKDGKRFVRFFGSDGVDRVCEVFDSKAFEKERGMSFKEFCARMGG